MSGNVTLRGRAAARARVLAMLPGAGTAQDLDRARPQLPQAPDVMVVRPDHLGDVLFLGPALKRLRDAWPGARITLMVGPWSRDVADRLPGIDRVTTFAFPWYDRRPKGPPWRPYVRLIRAARDLRRGGRPDVMLVMRDDDYWSAWAGSIAGVPIRIGHDHPLLRPFATHVLAGRSTIKHCVGENVRLVAALSRGAAVPADPAADPLVFRLRDHDTARAQSLLRDAAAGGRAAPVAVHPGSGTLTKQWRLGAWAGVIHQITGPGETVVLTGGDHERSLTSALASRLNRTVIDLAGQTEVGTLGAVFAQCRLVLGPDSGPLHLAAAVGTPTVHLFGPADPVRFGPWGTENQHALVETGLPCAGCGQLEWPDVHAHPCVRTIASDDVVRAARSCEGYGPNL